MFGLRAIGWCMALARCWAFSSTLQQLQRTVKVWADTADAKTLVGLPLELLEGVTTNPSLVYAGSRLMWDLDTFQQIS